MNQARPVATCNCGYPLLRGQTCPECGQPYDEAITHNLYCRPSAGCLPLAGVAGLLGASMIVLLWVSGRVHPNSAHQAAFAVMGPIHLMGCATLALTGFGIFLALHMSLLPAGHGIRKVSLCAALVGVVGWAGLLAWGILLLV